jgi:hypothetical protein
MRAPLTFLLLTALVHVGCGEERSAGDGSVDSGSVDAAADSRVLDAGGDASMDSALVADSRVSDAVVDADGGADAASDTAPVDAALPGKRVFALEDTLSPGDLGSAAAADTRCQNNADDEELGGTWMAWISDSTTSPADRFTRSTLPYRLLNGTLIANDWDDLVDGTIENPIDRTPRNSLITTGYAATGTLADGTATTTASSRCDDWTSGSSGSSLSGNITRTDMLWSSGVSRACFSLHRLYCFEQ